LEANDIRVLLSQPIRYIRKLFLSVRIEIIHVIGNHLNRFFPYRNLFREDPLSGTSIIKNSQFNNNAAKGTQHQWLLKTHHIKKRHRLTANTGNNTNPGNEIHSFPSGFIRPVANPAMAATAKAIVINTNKIYINFFILPILRFKQKRDYPEKTVPQFIHYNLSASGRDSFKKLIEAFLVEPLGSSSD